MIRLFLGRVARLRWAWGLGLGLGLLFTGIAGAQQKTANVAQRSLGYDVSREVSLQGTVITYSDSSPAAPFGPHLTLQTDKGVLDVHLANAQLIKANHFSLSSGDAVRIVGENVAYGTGTQFLARIIQKRTQTLALRTTRGFPLAPTGKLGPQAGAL